LSGSSFPDAARRAGIETTIGIHTGLCEQSSETVIGAAVEVSASIAALAAPFEILVSSSVKDLVSGAGLAFEGRGDSSRSKRRTIESMQKQGFNGLSAR